MKKNIIITGVAGMIGSNLLKKIISNKDNTVYGIDNLSLGRINFIDLKKKNFFFYNKDLSYEFPNIIKKIKFLDEVWLLSANSDILNGNKNINIDLNNTFLSVLNTLNHLETKISKNTKIIFSSSSAVYGFAKNKIDENNVNFRPKSNYGVMKLLAENYVKFFCNRKKCKYIIFRFPNVVGNNLTHGIIYDFNKKRKNKSNIFPVFGNGEQKKPYAIVSEVIDCMLYINHKINRSISVNIGPDDKGIKVKEIVKIFLKKFSIKKKVVYQRSKEGWEGDVVKYRYSTTLLNSLGYKFKLNSKEAIKKSLDFIKI
jgi:UDP-glucose 4-epimerase